MKTTFELQMNTMKSDFEKANATLNNKIVLLQNDVTAMNTKLDTGFNANQSLIAELSHQFKTFTTTLISAASSPTPDRPRKKQTTNESHDTTIEDDGLSAISDEDKPCYPTTQQFL